VKYLSKLNPNIVKFSSYLLLYLFFSISFSGETFIFIWYIGFCVTFCGLIYLALAYPNKLGRCLLIDILFIIFLFTFILSIFILAKFVIIFLIRNILFFYSKDSFILSSGNKGSNNNENNKWENSSKGGNNNNNNGGNDSDYNPFGEQGSKKKNRSNTYSLDELMNELDTESVEPDTNRTDYKDLAGSILRGINENKRLWILQQNNTVKNNYTVHLSQAGIKPKSADGEVLIKFATNYLNNGNCDPQVKYFCEGVLSLKRWDKVRVFNDTSFKTTRGPAEEIGLKIIKAIINQK
jgi:hypothetical protein